MEISGKIVLFKINTDYNREDIISILVDGVVSPISDVFLKMIYDIPNIEERRKYFTYRKMSLSIKYNNEVEDFKLDSNLEFSMRGWSYDDIDNHMSDSGVEIVESLSLNKNIKEKLLSLVNKKVEIKLNLK